MQILCVFSCAHLLYDKQILTTKKKVAHKAIEGDVQPSVFNQSFTQTNKYYLTDMCHI